MSKKWKVLTLKQKVDIIYELERTGDQASIVNRGIASKSAISRIWTNKEQILNAFLLKNKSTKKIKPSKHSNLEAELLLWFKEVRSRKIPISSSMLKEKANEIAKRLDIASFSCGDSWITRFKKRYLINTGTIVGESASVHTNTVKEFLENVWPEIRKEYTDANIFNADETGIFYKCTPNKTLKFKGETCSGGKLSKERLSVLLCSSSLGEKRKLLVIGKSLQPRCFKNKDISDFNYVANKKAWMTLSIFAHELSKWDTELRNTNRKNFFLLDNCPSHNIPNEFSNIKLVFLPANATSVLQPLDQGVIKNFKVQYKKILISKMIQSADSNSNLIISVYDALKFIDMAWANVNSECIKNCFVHSGLFSK